MTETDAARPSPRSGDLPMLIRRWWRINVIKSVEHEEILAKVREEAGWDARYAFMILMSAGIAVLGLLLSSPAVVIGAMLISPLMGPIIGLGFALATFDAAEIRRTLSALAGGTLLAVLFCALVVALSPLQNVTSEIAARTRPNLFDLVVALFSALAGAYAMIRARAGTVVGVAIATALMPPLAVVGFGLATWNGTVFSGALLLFITNFVTIAVSAAVMARLYGFGPRLSPKQTLIQSAVILGLLLVLAVPLGITLRQIAWEAVASRQARDVISSNFPARARISQVDFDFGAEPLRVSATMLTPEYQGAAERHVTTTLTQLFHRPVEVSLQQIRINAGTGAAEAAQIAQAQTSDQQRLQEQKISDVAARLALVSGVSPDAVLVDQQKKRAFVTATPLPGAGLATYYTLEQRVAATEPDWKIALIPPAAPLPDMPVREGKPDESAVAVVAWAAARLNLPVGVSGPTATRDAIIAALTEKGVRAEAAQGNPELRWLIPAPVSEP
ncbi:DUF389 domain-containing protein [Sphingomonas sp. C3-2]|uniref:DUF389 domain-containing protein n=1 Tax=Sphingomonas sp. C3-2 TaxID=3062169 RepID=UPI00294AE620|nr:DUF389 domain-containing protein [Sphingomonas sp. C3-2]WOK37659.1 DUF389 domain-containing protein [Sphingomonas sp. C3-2]